MQADTAALHRDFDRGDFFLDNEGKRPVAGFILTGEDAARPFADSGSRVVNVSFAFHSPAELAVGTILYQIRGGVHADTWEIQSPVEMDGASVYALRNVHRIS